MAKKRKSSSAVWTIDDLGTQILNQLQNVLDNLRPYRTELSGAATFIIALLVVLNLLGLTGGVFTNALGSLARSLFGWGAIPIMLLLMGLGGFIVSQIFFDEPTPLPMGEIIGVELITISVLVLLHIFVPQGNVDPFAIAKQGEGGGFVGWGLSSLLIIPLGEIGTAVLFALVGFTGIGLILTLRKENIQAWTSPITKAKVTPSPKPTPVVEEKEETHSVAIASPAPPTPVTATPPIPTTPPSSTQTQSITPRPIQPAMSAQRVREAAATAKAYTLPPYDLLAPASGSSGKVANARHQAQIIEETLTGFGVPAKVVEVNQGPTVTQFGVKPGYIVKRASNGTETKHRVRVSKINSLINDLALALSAAPIRIETPVPGRPIVGIEVPNTAVSMVSLRASIETDDFQRARKKLRLPVVLGKGVGGKVQIMDLAAQPHLLIAGATGSGKSVSINSTIINLLMTHTPNELKMLMIDPKMVELTAYNGIPHLISPVVTDFEQVAGALAWVTREMERRYKAFAELGARDIISYNKRVTTSEAMYYMVVIIDELADLMMLAADEVEKYIARIAQMARATGIHLIIATQRPSTDVVTGLIKANFPSRIAFAVSSQIDSRVIIDSPGAEKLLGKGDMLYMAPDSSKLTRLQGCFVSDNEIKNVVQYWKWAKQPEPTTANMMGQPATAPEAPLDKSTPWDDILEEKRTSENRDDLFDQAVELILLHKRASTSFLQRKMGIGYPRASRLIDQLEDEGVISPPNGANVRKILISAHTALTPSTQTSTEPTPQPTIEPATEPPVAPSPDNSTASSQSNTDTANDSNSNIDSLDDASWDDFMDAQTDY